MGARVQQVGEGLHVSSIPHQKLQLVEVNADHWKTWVHQRLHTPVGTSGAMTFHHAPPQEHLALAKHLTAERKVDQFVAGKGLVVRWEQVRRQNHWLDALYNASAAGWLCGARLLEERPPPRRRRPSIQLPEPIHPFLDLGDRLAANVERLRE